MEELIHYLSELHFFDNHPNDFLPTQLGRNVRKISTDLDLDECEVIIIGCGDDRGAGSTKTSFAPDQIRERFYELHYWHYDVSIGDLGNIVLGETIEDTYHAIATAISILLEKGKKIILLGGSHDLTVGQYKAYQKLNQLIHLTCIDSEVNLQEEEMISDQGFLLDLLTSNNNFIRHFTHIGFQTFYNSPDVLQSLDRLRFDCYRLGQVRHDLSSVEPDLRSTNALSVDLNVLRYTEASYIKRKQPNGLKNDELCQLIRYAGMNDEISTLGIYGYDVDKDETESGAEAIAQMIWYFIDGINAQKSEIDIHNIELFEQHIVKCSGYDILFMKSPKTERWWFISSDKKMIPCSETDFKLATKNEIPERWLRIHERII